MLYDVAFMFMVFIIYSVIGKIGEVLYYSYLNRKITDRGFYFGPYIPIWGIGALLLGPIIMSFSSQPLIAFFIGLFLGSIIEYTISYYMEKVYNARWWDYSSKMFNLNGRICLQYSIGFGLFSVLYIYFNPYMINYLKTIDNHFLITIAIIIFIVFITDALISRKFVLSLKRKDKLKSIDCTEDVKKEIQEMLQKKEV